MANITGFHLEKAIDMRHDCYRFRFFKQEGIYLVIKFCLSHFNYILRQRQAKIGLVQKAERYRMKYHCVLKTINKTSIWEEASMAVSRSMV